jgi:N12 class adenine-specific DNA methylase
MPLDDSSGGYAPIQPDPQTAARDRAAAVYYGMRERGYDHPTALGWAANAVVESNADPGGPRSPTGAAGTFQWVGPRLQQYRDMHGHEPEQGSLNEHLDHVLWENQHGEKDAANEIDRAPPDPVSKAVTIRSAWERPGRSPEEISQEEGKVAHAANWLMSFIAPPAEAAEPQAQRDGGPTIAGTIAGARQAGYSDADIYDRLAKSKTFGSVFDQARQAGHTDQDIQSHYGLKVGAPSEQKPAAPPTPQPAPAAAAPAPDTAGLTGDETSTLLGVGPVPQLGAPPPAGAQAPPKLAPATPLPAPMPGAPDVQPQFQPPAPPPPAPKPKPAPPPPEPVTGGTYVPGGEFGTPPAPGPAAPAAPPTEPAQDPNQMVAPGEAPVTQQSLAGAALNAPFSEAIKSTGQIAAAGPQLASGMAASARQFARGQMDVIKRVDAGETVPETEDASGYQRMTAPQRESFKAQLGADVGQTPSGFETGAGKLAQQITTKADVYAAEKAPVDPQYANNWLVRSTGMVGAFVPQVAATIVGGMPGFLASSFAQSYESTAQQALSKGASPEVAHAAAMTNGLVSAGLMAVPAGQWLGHLTPEIQGPVANMAASLATHSGTMVGISQTQTLADNLIAKQTYEPDRKLSQGLGENIPEQLFAGAFIPAALEAGRRAGPAVRGMANRVMPAGPTMDFPPPPGPYDAYDPASTFVRPRLAGPGAEGAPPPPPGTPPGAPPGQPGAQPGAPVPPTPGGTPPAGLRSIFNKLGQWVGYERADQPATPPPPSGEQALADIAAGKTTTAGTDALDAMAGEPPKTPPAAPQPAPTPAAPPPTAAPTPPSKTPMLDRLGQQAQQENAARAAQEAAAQQAQAPTTPGEVAPGVRVEEGEEEAAPHAIQKIPQQILMLARDAGGGMLPVSRVSPPEQEMLAQAGIHPETDQETGAAYYDTYPLEQEAERRAKAGTWDKTISQYDNSHLPGGTEAAPNVEQMVEQTIKAATEQAQPTPPTPGIPPEIEQIAATWEAMGNQGMAKSIRAGAKMGANTNPDQIAFLQQRLAEAQAKASPNAPKPQEAFNLDQFMQKTPSWKKFQEVASPEARAYLPLVEQAAQRNVDQANQAGWSINPTSPAPNDHPAGIARRQQMDLLGAFARFVNKATAVDAGYKTADPKALEDARQELHKELGIAGVNLRTKAGNESPETDLSSTKATPPGELGAGEADGKPPEPTPAAPVESKPAELPVIEHETRKGKKLQGVIVNGITRADAEAIDKYTFPKNGGFFIRKVDWDKAQKAKAPAPTTPVSDLMKVPVGEVFPRDPRVMPRHPGSEMMRTPTGWMVGDNLPRTPQPETPTAGAPTEHPGLIIHSLETGKETHIQPPGTVPPKETEQPQPEPPPEQPRAEEPPKTERPSDYGAGNKTFTADAAAAARARLRAKMGRLNTGFDPEMMMDGFTLAGFHIEAGMRRFGEFAKAMVEDLGEGIRPHLANFYRSVRDFHGFDNAGMDDDATVSKELQRMAESPTPAAETGNEPQHLDQPSQGPLAPIPTDQVQGTPGGGETRPSAEGSGGPDVPRDVGTGGVGPETGRGVGDGEAGVPVPAGGEVGAGAGAEQPVGEALPGGDRGKQPGSSGATGEDGSRTVAPSSTPAAGTPAGGRGDNFVHAEEDEIGKGGSKAKYRGNVAAIRLLRELDAGNDPATREQQAILSKWVGWGALADAFARDDGSAKAGWEKEVAELKALLTPEEYQEAAASTRNAHYTSPEVVKGMWDAMQRMGFNGGRLLEPSVGVGNFFGLMPRNLRSATALNGVEKDTVTSGLAKYLYPNAKIARMPFQDYVFPEGHFDAVVGNPPFGAEKLYDPQRRDLAKFSIHNYFFARSIDGLKPGGVMGMVVTNRLLDGGRDEARKYLSDRADLVGAIRLPNDAFKKNAGTEVTTDILFFRKRMPGEAPSKERWMDTRPYTDSAGKTVPLNEYFHQHPEMMLGEFGAYGSMRGPDEPALVARPGQDTPALLNEAIKRLPENIASPMQNPVKIEGETPGRDVSNVRVGSVFVDGKRVMQRMPDALGEQRAHPVEFANAVAEKRVRGMIEVRDALTELRSAQLNPVVEDSALVPLRERLNTAYDKFVKDNGPLNLDVNKRLFRDDPSWPQISALEDNFNKGVSATVAAKTGEQATPPSAKKAAIFTSRTQSPYRPPETAASAKDALAASLAERGLIDLNYMRQLYRKSDDEIIRELGDLVYTDPQSSLVTKDEYLSGNVKLKLAQARQAVATNPAYQRNVEALEAVQPADIEPVKISVKPGATWLSRGDMRDFASAAMGTTRGVEAMFNPANARWTINGYATESARARFAVLDRNGTARADVAELIEAAANQLPVVVYDHMPDKTRIVNARLTSLAKVKVQAITDSFGQWIWQDDDRRARLARLYNDTFNTDVKRSFDGSHLTLPGKVGNDIVNLRPTQMNAIWRIVAGQRVLLDHVVGAGKTYTIIAGAMELRRMGFAKKPMITVPNHLVDQWAADFSKLYPNANVLAATKKDFEAANRKRLFARIATGDWDAVIVPHSSLKSVAVEPRYVAQFMEEQISDLEASRRSVAATEGKKSRNVKQIEDQIAKLREKMKKLLDAPRRDDSLYWGELGVDALMVDEAHEFKNLQYSTAMNRVAGLGTQKGSQKAFDLFVKTRHILESTGDRNVVFATGTPISNTMAEMYTMQRYLDYRDLKAQGLSHFDAWARQFGQVVHGWELSPSGTLKMNSRFAKFVNLPELMQSYMSFADIINRNDINESLKASGKELPVPKVAGGKPTPVINERSERQANYIGVPIKDEDGEDTDNYPPGSLIWRSENLPKGPPKKGDDNMLKIMSDARKAALDMRLIDPNAPDDPNSKTNLAVKRVKEIYDQSEADKGAQLVFCDLSTPKNARAAEAERIRDLIKRADEGDDDAQEALDNMSPDEMDALDAKFSVYDDMKAKLIRAGIPANEIAFIHDANTDLQKAELFGKVRSGRVRVLMGSTQKMGAGMNVQERLVALHHMDAPWRPSDLEQREGRIIRQGNVLRDRDPENFAVQILRYATKDTLDARMWQVLESKANFIEQVRAGATGLREAEDVSGEAANSAEMKAASSGNPMILEEMELRRNIRELEAEQQGHVGEQYRILDSIKRSESAAPGYDAKADQTALDLDKVPETFAMNVEGQDFDKRADAGAAIITIAKSMLAPSDALGTVKAQRKIGSYGGFPMTLDQYGDGFFVTLSGQERDYEPWGRWNPKDAEAGGVSQRITNLVSNLPKEITDLRERAEGARQEAINLRAQVGEWAKQAQLDQMKQRHTEVVNQLQAKKGKAVEVGTQVRVYADPADRSKYASGEVVDGPNQGPNSSTVYTINTDDGETRDYPVTHFESEEKAARRETRKQTAATNAALEAHPATSEASDIHRGEDSGPTLYSFPGMLFDPANWKKMYNAALPAVRPMIKAGGMAVDATQRLSKSIADGVAPMRTGTVRAQAFASDFANSLRQIYYRFGEIDREIVRNFTPAQRDTMGRALDAQSVFEQQVRQLPANQQGAARAAFDQGGTGLAALPADQRAVIEMLNALSEQTWARMQQRGLVRKKAEGIPYYMPRQLFGWTEENGYSNIGRGGSGKGIHPIGGNLTTAGPMSRKYLTPEETEAAAKASFGANISLLRDIRSLPARLAYSERAIAGVDLMQRIKEVGKDMGVRTVIAGDLTGVNNPKDYFTIADHPSFRQYLGRGWRAIYVAKEFEGPLKAVLTQPSPEWYKGIMALKSGITRSIMYSPFLHLAVELGRTFPVMPGKVLTFQWLKQGITLRRDADYMDQAIRDGVAPLGHTGGWGTDPASIADQAFGQSRHAFIRAIQNAHANVAAGARRVAGETVGNIVANPHQTLLWDQVFNLQMSIYDTMRSKYIAKGYAPEVAGTMAAHIANRYAGALPPEHLGKVSNMLANLLLFSRSFTLGNLGVMKDMFTGAPPHIRARIEQMSDPDTAKKAMWSLRRKAISAVALDIGLFYAGIALVQLGLQALREGVDATYNEWLSEARQANEDLGNGNPMAVFEYLPQHWNEPGKQDRVYAGTDSDGKGIYLNLPTGKVGEEFMGWLAKPGAQLWAKLSQFGRPIVEDIIGHDSLGRSLYPPNPQTIWDGAKIAGIAVKHLVEGWVPTSTIEGAAHLAKEGYRYATGQPSQGGKGLAALKVIGPATGLGQVSSGYPGGPAAGEIHAFTERQKYDQQQQMPAIREQIKSGDVMGANAAMAKLGIPPREQQFFVQQTLHPSASKSATRAFQRSATPEERARLQFSPIPQPASP